MSTHYNEGNGKTTCFAKITAEMKVTKRWIQVTCRSCKEVADREIREF